MGFKFNGIHSNSYGIKVVKYSKPILPPVSVSSYDVPNKAGGIINQHKLSPKDIVISIYFNSTSDASYEANVRNMAKWLYSDAPVQLILDEEADRYYNAILTGDSNLDQLVYYGNGDLTFTCYDPLAYELTADTSTWATGSITSILANSGTIETFPTLSFTAWATAITIANTTTNQKIELTGLTVGDVLVVDNNEGTVTKGGNPANDLLSLDSEFFPLVVGSNTLNCGSSTHNTITTTWTNRYL